MACKLMSHGFSSFFFFNDPAPPEIYTLSLHDALPICPLRADVAAVRLRHLAHDREAQARAGRAPRVEGADRKSTRLNSSHLGISYAVFCLKKKNDKTHAHRYWKIRPERRFADDCIVTS